MAGALRELLAGVELQDHLVKETGSLEAATRRWGEVERLIAAVDRFEERAREAGKRPRWSELLAVMSQDNRDDGEQEVKKGQVTLATLHSAKGLEWRVVFILGCEEGLMPHRRVEGARISDAIAGDIEEERRLFYVGITRARDRLFLTRAAARLERGRKVERAPSRFMRELPAGGHATYEIAREEALTGAALQSMADAFLARLGDRDHVASGA